MKKQELNFTLGEGSDKLINDIADKDYQINKIKDSNNQDNKDFLDI